MKGLLKTVRHSRSSPQIYYAQELWNVKTGHQKECEITWHIYSPFPQKYINEKFKIIQPLKRPLNPSLPDWGFVSYFTVTWKYEIPFQIPFFAYIRSILDAVMFWSMVYELS